MQITSMRDMFGFVGSLVMVCVVLVGIYNELTESSEVSKYRVSSGTVLRSEDHFYVKRYKRGVKTCCAYECECSYEAKGQEYRSVIRFEEGAIPSGWRVPRTGDSVFVYYNPANPKEARLFKPRFPMGLVVVMLVFVGGLFLFFPFKAKVSINTQTGWKWFAGIAVVVGGVLYFLWSDDGTILDDRLLMNRDSSEVGHVRDESEMTAKKVVDSLYEKKTNRENKSASNAERPMMSVEEIRDKFDRMTMLDYEAMYVPEKYAFRSIAVSKGRIKESELTNVESKKIIWTRAEIEHRYGSIADEEFDEMEDDVVHLCLLYALFRGDYSEEDYIKNYERRNRGCSGVRPY